MRYALVHSSGAAIAAILGWSKTLLDRPWPWLGWANEAVHPWYVLHQSLIVLIAYWLVPLHLPVWIESPGVLVGTVAGCWIGFAAVRRIAVLRPLFGLKRASTQGSANFAAATAAA